MPRTSCKQLGQSGAGGEDAAGGRVRTLREPFAPGLFTEAGSETTPGIHDITQHYAREFGLKLLPTAVPGTRTFYYAFAARWWR